MQTQASLPKFTPMPEIVIIGGGITGLSCAFALQQMGVSFNLLEAGTRVGGNIQSIHTGPYLLDTGPNSIQLNQELYGLICDLGIQDEMITASPAAKKRYILRDGRYLPLPSGPFSLLFGDTFSWKAKRALMKEPKVRSISPVGESVDAFFRRRLGDEITDYAVYPFISGMFAGDPTQLMVETAFPRLLEWEQKHGSLLKGFKASRKNNSLSGIVSFRKGLGRLPEALYAKLNDQVILQAEVHTLTLDNRGKYQIAAGGEIIEADTVILALPAYRIASLMQEIDAVLSERLSKIHYPPVVQVHSAYHAQQLSFPLDGFGALHNHKEDSFTLGTIFSSSIFPDRCPTGQVLLTTFIGGTLKKEHALLPDEEILSTTQRELGLLLGITGNPIYRRLTRWEKAIPQYDERNLGHNMLLEDWEKKGLYLAGNWIGGISVNSCIQRGYELARKISLL